MRMKRTFLKRRTALAVLAVALGMGIMVGPTLAYYTDTTQANGSLPFSYSPETPPPPEEPEEPTPPPEEPEEPTPPPPPETEIREEIEGTNKVIRVENVGETAAVVRVRAFYGTANATVSFAGDGWGTRADGEEGWLYCAAVLEPGDVSEPLYINVEPVKSAAVDSFDIAIVQQCVAPDEAAEGEEPGSATFADGTVVLGELARLAAQTAGDEAENPDAGDEADDPAARLSGGAAAAEVFEGLAPVAEQAADLLDTTAPAADRA